MDPDSYVKKTRPMRFFASCFILCIGFFVSVPCLAQAPDSFLKNGELDLEAVVKHFEDLYRSDSSISTVELTVTRPRRTRTMTMKLWTRGRDKALIVIQEPAREAGTATLKVDENLWNYMPRIKRTIRIPPSMMLASWMGTDFTNDDLVREASYLDDYEYQLAGRSDEPAGWVVRFDARPELIGLWSRIDLVLSEDGTIPLQARYYDRRGRLARTMRWEDVREFDGRRLPARMTLEPEDEEGHKTEMRYLAIQFDADVPESTFSLSYLERQR
jgi:outer membrane lipoprotein-sorting protein